ncbi:hypothetical protein P9112_011114 [Eukaryota sp. TZLM1-RC]
MDVDLIIEQLRNSELPPERQVQLLCTHAVDMLMETANVINVHTPITVVGDIHGQFYDLLELFLIAGEAPDTKFLFLGDYVDRGFYSVETFLLLLSLKVRYPDRVFLLRGNHESRQITQVYGFYDECVRKYGSLNFYHLCVQVFDVLPLAALIDGKVFSVHGGLSPSLSTIDQIRAIDRQVEVPHDGLMCDLLWSDPADSTATELDVSEDMGDVMPVVDKALEANKPASSGWSISPRGAGYLFGRDATSCFLEQNNLEFMCRAHQLVFAGHQDHFDKKVFTVWSAPNYCYRVGNVASVMQIDEQLNHSFKLFDAAPKERRGPLIRKPIVDYFL